MNMPLVWIPEGDDEWVRGPGQWFSEAPEHDGWYWQKPFLKAPDHPLMLFVFRTGKGRLIATDLQEQSDRPVEDYGGWWLGPLAPPD